MIKLITPLTQVDSSAAFTLGSKTTTKDGNEYIYLSGNADVAAKNWVTFTAATGSVTRFATRSGKGQVAVAISDVTAPNYGWFCTKGLVTAYVSGVTTAGLALYSSGTVAQAGGSVTVGGLVAGAFISGTWASGSVTCWIDNPFCTNTLS